MTRGGGVRTAVLAVAVGAAAALAGESRRIEVVDPDGEPVAGARLCYVAAGSELLCVASDGRGVAELPASRLDAVRVTADGFLPKRLSVKATAGRAVALTPSPVLTVRLLDAASGEPLESGRVWVVYPTGAERGPFPVNAAGVRIRRVLRPGEARVRAEADGYRPPVPADVRLEPGREIELSLRLDPNPRASPSE